MILRNYIPMKAGDWRLGSGQEGIVSVVVPVLDRSQLIRDTLDSVYRQHYRPLELMVVDDGSSDDTVKTVCHWAARHGTDGLFAVRVIEQQHRGAPAARNRGVKESTGEFIQFLDSDDVLDPEKVLIQVEALKCDEQAEYAYGRVYDLETGHRLLYGHSEMSPNRMLLKQIVNPAFSTPGPLFRRCMLERLGPWDEELPMCQDWEYHSRMAALRFRGVFTATARSLVRLEGGGRVSWSNEPDRAELWYSARMRQLGSMWFHADADIRQDGTFRSSVAWGVLLTSARAESLHCRVDGEAAHRAVLELAAHHPVARLSVLAGWVRSLVGREAAARLILATSWFYYRASALQVRISRIGGALNNARVRKAMSA